MNTAKALPLGKQLDDIARRMTEAGKVWVAAGYPMSGPEFEAREAVFADLRAWNQRAGAAG